MAADPAEEPDLGQSRWSAAATAAVTRNGASGMGPRARLQKVSANAVGCGQIHRFATSGARPDVL